MFKTSCIENLIRRTNKNLKYSQISSRRNHLNLSKFQSGPQKRQVLQLPSRGLRCALTPLKRQLSQKCSLAGQSNDKRTGFVWQSLLIWQVLPRAGTFLIKPPQCICLLINCKLHDSHDNMGSDTTFMIYNSWNIKGCNWCCMMSYNSHAMREFGGGILPKEDNLPSKDHPSMGISYKAIIHHT